MRALSLDMSSGIGSVAIVTHDTVLASASVDLDRQPLRECARLVGAVLRLAELRIEDVNILSSVTGPGSWTGLRVSAVTVNTIATALRKPVVGVSIFESLSNYMQGRQVSTIGVVQVSATHASVSELAIDTLSEQKTQPYLVELESLASTIAPYRAIVSMRPGSLTLLRSQLPPGVVVDIRDLPALAVISARAALYKYNAGPAEFERPITPFYAGSPVSEEGQGSKTGKR
jgi:tRNA threonylcarbamoyl adenosine modification protein YeaZ